MTEQATETCRKPPSSDDEDSDEEVVFEPKRETIPDAVDSFLGYLLEAMEKRDIKQIHKLYEEDFNKLSDRHFKSTRWPSPATVEDQISSNALFLILYRELYYRHIFSRNVQTFEDRKGSWENYCRLFDLFLLNMDEGEDFGTALPAQWLWDILDEFVYHYQVFCTYRGKVVKTLTKQAELDLRKFQEHPQVFETHKVLMYLHDIISKSHIQEYLTSSSEERQAKQDKAGAFKYDITRRIGYFAVMQLLRMHSLLGDYHLAMRTVACLDFKAEAPMYYQIPACHIHLYYYTGFAYLMLRRYVDAIRTFCDILVFLQKTSGVNDLSYQYATMVKKQESMYSLLLICLVLSPQQVDEMIERTIRDKHNDKQMRLQRELNDSRETQYLQFEELFTYHCPKFVSPAPPDFALFQGGEDFDHVEAHKRQVMLFLQEVRQQQALPTIGSYMRLYTSIQISKLAQLCETDEDGLRDQLMCVMHKTRQPVRLPRGEPLSGEPQSCSEVQFYLDGDTVHINAQREQRPHTEFFLEQIVKFQDLLRKTGAQ